MKFLEEATDHELMHELENRKIAKDVRRKLSGTDCPQSLVFEINGRYRLRYAPSFCHVEPTPDKFHQDDKRELIEENDWIFIGTIRMSFGGLRNIFYAEGRGIHMMFSVTNSHGTIIEHEYLVKQLDYDRAR